MEALPLWDLMVPEDLAIFLLMVLEVLVVLGDLVAFLLMALEGLVALHLVVLVDPEASHLLEVSEGLVVCLLVVLVVPVALAILLLEALMALAVLILEINPPWVDFPIVLPHKNLFISLPMALLVITCHINITNMYSPIDSYLSLKLWTFLICLSLLMIPFDTIPHGLPFW